MEILKQRCIIDYNRKEKISISRKLQILSLQIEDKSDDGINTIWGNQDTCGDEICKVFNNKSIVNCLVYGMTQTGKTGCMTSLIQHYCLTNLIPINNIYIITGLSDREWKKDTKNRMPDSINSRVFHRANLTNTFLKDISEKRNTLIIMDEIQIACEEEQTIHKTFKDCGFYNLDLLLENDIKLVQFSATPDGNLNDISDWKNYSTKVKLQPGTGYYGPAHALFQKRVKQFKDLCNENNVKELKTFIEDSYSTPRYHLIRVPNKRVHMNGKNNQEIVISNFTNIFESQYEFNIDYLKTKKDDINKLLINKPSKHTFVFYCEILRCAKTQIKKYIGISYERFVNNPNDSSIIQGSFGRLTGYDDNGESICYTNISTLENYVKLWKNNMEFKKGIIWNTKTTNYNKTDDITYSTGTFNSVKYIGELKDNCSEKVKTERGDPIIKKFQTFDELKKFVKENLKSIMQGKRGPNMKKINDNGFYEATIKKVKKVWSCEEMNNKPYIGSANNNYWHYPCYRDVSDPSTLEWWLIYYD
jgi:hypothetical protein